MTQPTSIQTHPMVTRTQVGTVKRNPRIALHTSSISLVPKSSSLALSDLNWRDAMQDKYNALIKNSTWILILKPPNVNIVRLIVKPTTVRTVLSLALSRKWHIHPLDVKDARLNSSLLETKKYALELLVHAHMLNCNLCRPHVDTESKLGLDRPQHTLSRSSAEVEYHGVAKVVTETAWLRNLLRELHSPPVTTTLVYCDNVSAIYLTGNPVQHQRTKHIEIDIHFVCDMVAGGQVRVLHVSSRYQYDDIFTKSLPF
nr:NBS-containing resistance-like protein [Tanacetum cinerariifolium]